MDNRFIRLFLISTTLLLAGINTSYADESILDDEPVLDPNVVRLGLKDTGIDDENFEIGAFLGFMSVEHFGTHEVYGLRGAWHVNEDLFFELNYGHTTVGSTPAEYVSGQITLTTEDSRDFNYYNLSLGFNVLPGEVFMTRDWAFNSAVYLLAGVGSVDFFGEQNFAINLGVGLRVLATDSLAVHLTFQDIMTDKLDVLSDGTGGSAHNMQYTGSLTYFF